MMAVRLILTVIEESRKSGNVMSGSPNSPRDWGFKMFSIIGGTGIYNLDWIEVQEEFEVQTPFGKPSSKILKGKFKS